MIIGAENYTKGGEGTVSHHETNLLKIKCLFNTSAYQCLQIL